LLALADFGEGDRSARLPAFLPWILVWLLLVLVVAFLVVRQEQVAGFASRARTAPATVIAREPNNHATVRAVYEVDGTMYEVADSFIGPPNPNFDVVKVGDAVTVFYDPATPSRGVLSEPQVGGSSEVGVAILAALVLPALFVGALVATLRLWKVYRSRDAHPRVGARSK
jgi:hypothetical protein